MKRNILPALFLFLLLFVSWFVVGQTEEKPIVPLSDLIVESISLEKITISDGIPAYEYTVYVKNIGSGNAFTSSLKTEFNPFQPQYFEDFNGEGKYRCYRGGRAPIPQDYGVKEIAPSGIAVDSDYFNPVTAGEVTIKASIDIYNSVKESNETNNVFTKTFKVEVLIDSALYDSSSCAESTIGGEFPIEMPPYEGSGEVEEQVKCVFNNSIAEEKCYTVEDSPRFCSGVGACVVSVRGKRGQELGWKSSCGGYASTIIDGENEHAVFYCTHEEVIESDSFRYAYWQCYDGTEQKQGGEESCKPSEVWSQYAQDFCKNYCDKETGKCGVNSFYVDSKCKKIVYVNPPAGGGTPIPPGEDDTSISIVCNGCEFDQKCYFLGYRKSGNYCSEDYKFVEQSQDDAGCENNFECGSNVCVSGQCVSSSLIQRILDWFRKLFGGE